MAVRLGLTTDGLNLPDLPQHLKGVTCYFCHTVEKVEDVHNNPLVLAGDGVMRGGIKDPKENPAHKGMHSDYLDRTNRKSAYMCGSCHDVFNFPGLRIEEAYTEYQSSPSKAMGQRCQDCHMGKYPGRFVEGDNYDHGPAAYIGGKPER